MGFTSEHLIALASALSQNAQQIIMGLGMRDSGTAARARAAVLALLTLGHGYEPLAGSSIANQIGLYLDDMPSKVDRSAALSRLISEAMEIYPRKATMKLRLDDSEAVPVLS